MFSKANIFVVGVALALAQMEILVPTIKRCWNS